MLVVDVVVGTELVVEVVGTEVVDEVVGSVLVVVGILLVVATEVVGIMLVDDVVGTVVVVVGSVTPALKHQCPDQLLGDEGSVDGNPDVKSPAE